MKCIFSPGAGWRLVMSFTLRPLSFPSNKCTEEKSNLMGSDDGV
jgi:hypothetical protein